MTQTIRIGIIGAGANTRSRHIPGFLALPAVQLTAICNRRPESTAAVADQFGITMRFSQWEDLVNHAEVDAVVIGTWPYLHCPIALAALAAGKHVLTEARMAMDADEARQMLAASQKQPRLVAQIVPSPFGLKGDRFVRELIAGGYLGEFREAAIIGINNAFGGPDQPLHWRQDATLSGYNMLQVGILHETLLRWTPSPVGVMAQAHAFIPSRLDPESGTVRQVGTPDSVQIIATLQGGGRATYQFNGVSPVGAELAITLRGSTGLLHYDLLEDRLYGLSLDEAKAGQRIPKELVIPEDKAGGWRVEADFIDSIRAGRPVTHTDFATGVAYMQFTEAVAQSARDGVAVSLPLNGR